MMDDERCPGGIFLIHRSSFIIARRNMDPDSGTNSGNLSLGEGDPLLASLEQRVQRLEDAVAVLQEGAGKQQVKAGPVPKESDHIMAGSPPEQAPPNPEPVSTRPPWLIVDILNETRT